MTAAGAAGLADLRVVVLAGEGLVARAEEGVLLVLPGGDVDLVAALVAALEQACVSGAPAPGRRLARRLRRVLDDADADALPPFGAVAAVDDGLALMLQGPVTARAVVGGHEQLVSGADALTWVDRMLPAPVGAVTVAAPERAVPVAEPPGGVQHAILDLRSGVVPGAAVALWPRHAESSAAAELSTAAGLPEEAAPPAPAPQPAATAQPDAADEDTLDPADADAVASRVAAVHRTPGAAPFRAVLLRDSVAGPRPPLPVETGELPDLPGPGAAPPASGDQPGEDADEAAPLVGGVLCRNDHFNHPEAAYCAVCGVALVHRTRLTVERPRPVLGVLVTDAGATHSLDVGYVIGRRPHDDPAVRAGRARPLVLDDADRSVSRVHAEIRLRGWDVEVVDRGSGNGTFVLAPGSPQWAPLQPDRPVVIAPGTRVACARHTLAFESHHQVWSSR